MCTQAWSIPHRVAMISMHTSPLATPGVGDAGGLNVYVAELARRLGERGLKVDVFTRRNAPDVPDIVDVHEHTRVINLKAGPAEHVAKEALPALIDEFCTQLEARLDDHDLIHSHYWLSGAGRSADQAPPRPTRWCTPCTPWLGSRTPISE